MEGFLNADASGSKTSEHVHLHSCSLPFSPLPAAAILVVEIDLFMLIIMELAPFHTSCHLPPWCCISFPVVPTVTM